MDEAQCLVTLGDGFQNNSERNDVINFLKREVLGNHFIIDAVNIFISAQQLALQIGCIHCFFDVAFYLFNIFFAVGLRIAQKVFNSSKFLRLAEFEC